MTGESILGWLGFALSGVVYVATIAFLIGKISSSGAAMTKELESMRVDFNAFRSEVQEALGRLATSLQHEAIHGVRISAKLEGQAERLAIIERAFGKNTQ